MGQKWFCDLCGREYLRGSLKMLGDEHHICVQCMNKIWELKEEGNFRNELDYRGPN